MYYARTKHIEVDYHFVREKVFNQDISIRFISTHDQISNIFTKGLSSARFLTLKSKLMVVELPITLKGDVNLSNTLAVGRGVQPVAVAVICL